MALDSKVSLAVVASLTKSLDLANAAVPLSKSYAASLTNGVAAGQADRVFHDQRPLAASASEDLDLAGVLVDALGDSIAFAKIKALIISAAAGNTNNVVVGGAATNGFVSWVGGATHTVTVRPGATLALFAGSADSTGYAVTAGTADLLKVANSGAGSTVTYDIIVIGTSA